MARFSRTPRHPQEAKNEAQTPGFYKHSTVEVLSAQQSQLFVLSAIHRAVGSDTNGLHRRQSRRGRPELERPNRVIQPLRRRQPIVRIRRRHDSGGHGRKLGSLFRVGDRMLRHGPRLLRLLRSCPGRVCAEAGGRAGY